MRTVSYTTSVEKQALVDEAETQGETQIHDDHFFDTGGDGFHGELTFDVIIEPPRPPPTVEEVQFEELRGKIRDDLATLSELRKYLVLRDGLS